MQINLNIIMTNVSVTYVTLVPWRRERRRHVGWPTKLGSRQRDQSTSSVTKRANGHWHVIIASSCRWSQREYKRQQVHRINSCFHWGAEPVTRQLSGGTATVATGRLRTQEEIGSTRRLQNLANVLGVAQPTALQMSASEASRAAPRMMRHP